MGEGGRERYGWGEARMLGRGGWRESGLCTGSDGVGVYGGGGYEDQRMDGGEPWEGGRGIEGRGGMEEDRGGRWRVEGLEARERDGGSKGKE